MNKDTLDDQIDNVLKDDSSKGEAVKHLLTIRPRVDDEIGTDIEIKTELNEGQICTHVQADMLNLIMSMSPEDWGSRCIMGDLVTLKERKQLSLNRRSRSELIEMTKTPEPISEEKRAEGFLKKIFTPRQ